jgi:hypothetical protein
MSHSAFREIPQSVEPVLAAARRLYPQHSLFLTIAPAEHGPTWEFHPYKRWLVLRTDDPEHILEAVACSLLARTAWLGKGAVTAVPEPLRLRYRQALDALVGALESGPDAEEVRS